LTSTNEGRAQDGTPPQSDAHPPDADAPPDSAAAGQNASSHLMVFAKLALAACLAALLFRAIFPSRPIPEETSLPELVVAGWFNGAPPQDLRGKVVVVDIWATACQPCIVSKPDLIALHEKYQRDDLQFVSLTPEPATYGPHVQSTVAAFAGWTWPIGYGAEATCMAMQWDRRVPTYLIFNRQGRAVFSSHSLANFENALITALAEPRP